MGVAISEEEALTDGESSRVDTEEIGNFHPSQAESSGPEEEECFNNESWLETKDLSKKSSSEGKYVTL